MTRVPIAGVGMTPFGKSPERTSRELFGDAARKAFEDAGLDPEDVDEVFYGNFMGERTEQQGHSGPLAAAAAGVNAPATRIDSACASSSAAIRLGVERVRNGADCVLVGGAERMTHVSTAEGTAGLAAAADALWEINQGVTFPGAYGLMATRYFEKYDAERDDLAEIAVKNHRHAADNDLAHFQREVTVEDVHEAPTVCSPFSMYHCSPMSDGGSAALLVSESFADATGLAPEVAVIGTGQGTDQLALHDRVSMTRTPAAERAAEVAYDDAGVGPDDIDLAEVHDCFTIAEVLALEAVGFYEHGRAIGAARRGETTKDGELPVNLSGGLKAKGHPVGATGGGQISELTKLLRGDHVNSDAVEDAQLALAHNAGGTVASCVIHVLEVST